MKQKTNEQIFKAFAKDASDMELVFARAWLTDMARQVKVNPGVYGTIWNPDLILDVATKIDEAMGLP